MILTLGVVVALSSGCSEAAKSLHRLSYNYPAERQQCRGLHEEADYKACVADVDEAQQKAIDPVTLVARREEERRALRKGREERERKDRIRAHCSSAPDLIRASFAKRAYAQAYKIAEESDAVCSERDAINAMLLSEIRKLSPQEVASSRSDAIARSYWRPIEIWAWLAAAGRGNLISTNGVYIPGTVEQQFDDHVVLEVSETVRVVLRLDRKRFFQTSDLVYVIGRFVEIGRFTTALGIRTDMPVFDAVYWLG